MDKHKKLLIFTSLLGILAVVLGAFGAHGLKSVLTEASLNTFNTGVKYHFYHLIALFGISILYNIISSKWYYWSAICFIIGIILFSGSIYLLATKEVIGLVNYKWLGPITPLGGLFFIAGWLFIGIGSIKSNDQ